MPPRRCRLLSVQKWMWIASGRSSFASQIKMLKKVENKVGARTHCCLTLLGMGKLSDSDPLCFS